MTLPKYEQVSEIIVLQGKIGELFKFQKSSYRSKGNSGNFEEKKRKLYNILKN